MAPSVSYSITVRLEVASRGRAVSEITRAVEHTGGVVTALDVTAGGNEHDPGLAKRQLAGSGALLLADETRHARDDQQEQARRSRDDHQ